MSRALNPASIGCAFAVWFTACAVLPAYAADTRRDHTTVVMGNFIHDDPTAHTLRHPHRFKVESEDSYVVFFKLRWRHWGSERSRAEGRARTCEYEGDHCFKTEDVRLTAKRRIRCDDDYAYNRVVASHIPMYGKGPIDLPVKEQACG